jgi:hypothetical protein
MGAGQPYPLQFPLSVDGEGVSRRGEIPSFSPLMVSLSNHPPGPLPLPKEGGGKMREACASLGILLSLGVLKDLFRKSIKEENIKK